MHHASTMRGGPTHGPSAVKFVVSPAQGESSGQTRSRPRFGGVTSVPSFVTAMSPGEMNAPAPEMK